MQYLLRRILCKQLSARLFFRHSHNIIFIGIIPTEEETNRILCCILFIILCLIIPFQIIIDCIIVTATDDRCITNVVHVTHRIIRTRHKVYKCLSGLLFFRILSDSALQHNPAVKPQIRRLLRHRKIEIEIILFCLIHRIDSISGPLVVCNDLSADHVCFTAVGLKRINIALHILQDVLYILDRIGIHIIHDLHQSFLIIRCIAERFIHQFIFSVRTKCRKIRIPDIILDRNLALELVI